MGKKKEKEIREAQQPIQVTDGLRKKLNREKKRKEMRQTDYKREE